MPIIQHKNKQISPILNSLFEINYKGKGNNTLLSEETVGYELRSDRNVLIINFETSEEELYNLIESIKGISLIGILLHDRIGNGIMKLGMEAQYIGPVIKQSYDSNELFEFHAAFKIDKLTTVAIKKD